MLTDNDLKQLFLHPDMYVREQAALTLSSSFNEDEELLPLALEAWDRYGHDASRIILNRCERFRRTDTSFLSLVEALEKGGDKTRLAVLNTMIDESPCEFIRKYESRLLDSPNLKEDSRCRIERRLQFATFPAHKLWVQFCLISGQLDESESGRIDLTSQIGELIDALAIYEYPTNEEIVELIADDYFEGTSFTDVLLELAGARRIRQAIPALLDKYLMVYDQPVDIITSALAQIGDPQAVRLAHERYPQENWDFRLGATALFTALRCPESEEAILDLIDNEEDSVLRELLCEGLCSLFSERALEVAQRLMKAGIENEEEGIRGHMLILADVFGVKLPEDEKWRAERDERREAVMNILGEGAELRFGSDDDLYDPDDDEDLYDEDDAPTYLDSNRPPLIEFDKLHSVASRKAAPAKTIGRNAKCPCGSGRKYKNCCEGKK